MLQYSSQGCIRYAGTSLVTLGSERRSNRDVGWQGEQFTGPRHVIAFSFLPIKVAFSGEHPVLLSPPTVAMTVPGGGYTRKPQSGDGQRTIFISIDTPTAQSIVAPYNSAAIDSDDPFPARCGPSSVRAMVTAQQLERLLFASHPHPEPIEFEEIALWIVTQSLNTYFRIVGGSTKPLNLGTQTKRRDQVDRVLAMLCNAPARRWSLREIADDIGVSAPYLSRIFRAHANRTMTQCLKRIRVVRALGQISDRRGELTALALECGFSSHAHMSSTFSSLLGAPPRVFAQQSARAIRKSIKQLAREIPET